MTASKSAKRRTWRLATAVAIGMLAVALIVVVRSLMDDQVEGLSYGAPRLILSRVLTFLFLSIPAGLVAVAVVRRSPTMLVVAGAISILQSLIAFSGALFGFLLPGFLLLYLGAREGDAPDSPRPPVRERVSGLVIIGLVVAAWLVTLSSAGTPTVTGLISAAVLIGAAFALSARSGSPRQP